jgi:hypothetical protein
MESMTLIDSESDDTSADGHEVAVSTHPPQNAQQNLVYRNLAREKRIAG